MRTYPSDPLPNFSRSLQGYHGFFETQARFPLNPRPAENIFERPVRTAAIGLGVEEGTGFAGQGAPRRSAGCRGVQEVGCLLLRAGPRRLVEVLETGDARRHCAITCHPASRPTMSRARTTSRSMTAFASISPKSFGKRCRAKRCAALRPLRPRMRASFALSALLEGWPGHDEGEEGRTQDQRDGTY